jgi:hypothetical protein
MALSVKIYPRDSAILIWDNVKGADHYRVNWVCPHDAAENGSKIVVPAVGMSKQACQVQPLRGDCMYNLTVSAIKPDGSVAETLSANNVTPQGTYEASLYELTQGGGYLFDPKRDKPNVRPSAQMLHSDIHVSVSGDVWDTRLLNGISLFGRNGSYNNHQYHWHMFLSELGTGSHTMRCEQPITLPFAAHRDDTHWPKWIVNEEDPGPRGRQTRYWLLTSHKHDRIDVFPSQDADNRPLSTQGFEVRVKAGRANNLNNLTLMVWMNGVKLGQVTAWITHSWINVRQIKALRLWPDRVELLIDQNYTGDLKQMQVAATIPCAVDMVTDPLWFALTLGSYNQSKHNQMTGYRPNGERVKQYCHGGIGHNGFLAHNAAPTLLQLPEVPIIGHPHHAGHHEDDPDTGETAPLLDTMPAHDYLATWCIPTVLLTRSAKSVTVGNPLTLTIQADTLLTPLFAGDPVLIKALEIRGNGVTLWREELTVPLANVTRNVTLTTGKWAGGDMTLEAVAITTSGSMGVNQTNDIYGTVRPTALQVLTPVVDTGGEQPA